MNADWLSVLPPLVAIAFVLWRREVIMALVLAILTSELLLQASPLSGAPGSFIATLERTAAVLTDADNARILLFSLLIGALIALMRLSGGVTALVNALVGSGIASNGRRASLLTSGVGAAVFVESNLSVLTAGILSRGLFDRFGLSRAKLAYIIDSTSAPICILILLNGWGAYILVLLNQYEFEQTTAEILWGSVALNFYAIVTLLIVFLTAWTGRTFGPLSRSEAIAHDEAEHPHEVAPTHPAYMVVPLAVMIVSMVGFMLWTGNGVLAEGSGSRSVLYAVSLACTVAYLMMLSSRRFGHSELIEAAFKGMAELLPLVAIVLFSLALGASLRELGTGVFIAGLAGDFMPPFMIPAMLFLAGALISFSTGTSWGTFAILIPIGMPLATALGMPPSLLLAAILGGGVFGDHCSPISDTTCVSAIASGCDLLEHVRTQLPYALTAGAITLLLYLAVGLFTL